MSKEREWQGIALSQIVDNNTVSEFFKALVLGGAR